MEYHLKNVKCQKPTGVLAYQKPDQLKQTAQATEINLKNINRYKCQMPHCDQRFEKLVECEQCGRKLFKKNLNTHQCTTALKVSVNKNRKHRHVRTISSIS